MNLLHLPAPDFEGESTGFNPLHLSKDFAQQPLIIYFYPKDFTPICTTEAKYFSDTYTFFEKLNIKILGISKDNLDTHFRFKQEHNLPFDLVADPTHSIAKKYDAYDELFDMTKRITYLLDNQHLVKGIYRNAFENQESIEKMILEIKKDVVNDK